jgi:hypothetical protein
MTSRIMILLDFEILIFLAFATVVTCARGAQQALIESSEGDDNRIDEGAVNGCLKMAF